MFQGHRIGAVLLMGGEGRRFGREMPKQFCLLAGKRVYLHTLEVFLESGVFDEIVLACHPEWLETVREEVKRVATLVVGGASRQESSYAGLKGFLEKPDIVAIHDAVRPLVSEQILIDNIRAAIAFGAVDTCIPSADTLVYAPDGKVIEHIPERSCFLRGQTPQTFRYDWILQAHAAASGLGGYTDDCSLLLKIGRKVHIVSGSQENLKITSKTDLQVAEKMMVEKKKDCHYSSFF